MTGTCTSTEIDSESDALATLNELITSDDVLDELITVIGEAADAIIDAYDPYGNIDGNSLSRDLTIGYAEWISVFFHAGVTTADDVPALIDDIRMDPIGNCQLVLGRMADRSRVSRVVSRAMWDRRRSSSVRR